MVLIDNSRTIAGEKAAVKKALQQLPANVQVGLIGVNDTADEIESEFTVMAEKKRALAKFDALTYAGGPDNSFALTQALAKACDDQGLAIFWIHGQQINERDDIANARALSNTFKPATQLVDWNIDTSADLLMDDVLIPAYPVLSQRSTLPGIEKQGAFWQNLTVPKTAYSLAFDKVIDTTLPISYDEAQVARVSTLWAQQEALALLGQGRTNESAQLGTIYRLVTPVTGATVLATESDYLDYGLDRNAYKIVDASVKSDASSGDKFVPANIADYKSQNWPVMQGATNGTIGPQGSNAIVLSGVNTSGTVRLNQFANLEALANIMVAVVCFFAGAGAILQVLWALLKSEAGERTAARIYTATVLALIAISLPGIINQCFCLAKAWGLFS